VHQHPARTEVADHGRGGGRLVSVGSVVVDVLARVEALPSRGGDVWASRMRMAAGGGFHAMAAAARAGVPVTYAGAHGTGPFGDLARATMRAEGIQVLRLPRAEVDTGVVIVLVDGGGERTFVSGRGAEATLGPADLAGVRPDPGDAVLVSGYGLDDALADWVLGLPAEVVVAYDPGPLARPGPFAAVRPRLDWVSANATEAAALAAIVVPPGHAEVAGAPADCARRPSAEGPPSSASRVGVRGPEAAAAEVDGPGRCDPAEAARVLAGRAGAVVRVGAGGCVVAVAGAEPVPVPAVAVRVVDTTGAGDTHTGAFLAALLAGAPPVEAARRANAAAAAHISR